METTPAVGVGRRRIIKRPRLTRMLDESGARIILLVAPAGYGKTTLAREWLEDKRAVWYRGSPASADVAALAVGIASAAAEVMPGAGDRMKQRLRVTDRPEEDARILAEMLAEDLTEWPDDAWLVTDDYHFAMDSPAAETFVAALIESSPLQLVIASRRRPTWATARLRVYGHVYEFDRTLLAMSDREALDVLSQRSDAAELVRSVSGWPAVIGLAALTTGSSFPPSGISTTLYDYFAEELLQGADPSVRGGLCRLSVMPCITDESASFLLGDQVAARVLAESASSGVLSPQADGQFDLHPLFRTFLQERLTDVGGETASTVKRAGTFLLHRRRWDDALSLAERFPDPEFVEAFIESAWETLLDEGRHMTLSRLLDLAAEQRRGSGLLDLIEAEIAFRQASYRRAETLALDAAERLTEADLLVRAYVRAGQSAHLEGRDEDALEHHRRGRSLASDRSQQRESLWGELVCSIELESVDCRAILDRLQDLGVENARDAVRLANGRMLLATRTGSGIEPGLLSAVHRLPKVDDPLVRSSFLHMWSCVLTFTGRYEEALEVTAQQLQEAGRYRLEFVLPHAQIRRALAYRGLRQFREALDLLARAQRDREATDDYVAISADTARIGIFLATGDNDRALSIHEPPLHATATPHVVAELVATKALALACADRLPEAQDAARRAVAISSAAEPRLLAAFAEVVFALQTESEGGAELLEAALDEVLRSENIDVFVTAYRAFPRILVELARDSTKESMLRLILTRANDRRLEGRVLPGAQHSRVSRQSLLTVREREILALVAKGHRNREIAEKLFISEVTVKAHVRNILRKLGARSRAQAVSLAELVD